MKLSEAILAGSKLRPQGFFYALVDGKTCAFGAALEAKGVRLNNRGFNDTVSPLVFWPWLREVRVPCPQCGKTDGPDVRCIISEHLNDDHRWTRERIAEWVATIEPQKATAA